MADSKRKIILDRVRDRMKLILTINDFMTDAGKYVFVWKQRPWDLETYPAILVMDTTEEITTKDMRPTGGTHEHMLEFKVGGITKNPASSGAEDVSNELLQIMQDIQTAIRMDPTWGKTALWTIPGNVEKFMDMEEKIIGGITQSFKVQYRTLAFDAVNVTSTGPSPIYITDSLGNFVTDENGKLLTA
jgi:hypothetical protein